MINPVSPRRHRVTVDAQVAGLLTLVAAGPIAWLYSANAAQLGIERRATDPVSMVPEQSAAQEHHAA
ncbi:MAG TPA: hypothetical protein VFH62_07260 [Dehalococcoidia bacterium]|nr:hypothetical protein [Dehalococcoidia bacterium]